MARRVNPTMLLCLVVVIVLSLGISAGAQLAGDTANGPIGGTPQQPLTAGTAEAALKDARISLHPETLDVIWRRIVTTFSWVLGGATAGLVMIVILDIFYPVELAHVQIMLTMFTTVAGILAGFITGQAVGTAQERGR